MSGLGATGGTIQNMRLRSVFRKRSKEDLDRWHESKSSQQTQDLSPEYFEKFRQRPFRRSQVHM